MNVLFCLGVLRVWVFRGLGLGSFGFRGLFGFMVFWFYGFLGLGSLGFMNPGYYGLGFRV